MTSRRRKPRPPASRLAALAAVLLAVGLLLAGARTVVACGPYFTEVRFWPREDAGVAWERYVDGDLGILDVGQSRLGGFVAYRHLAGPPLGADDRAALARLGGLRDRDTDWSTPPPPNPLDDWLAARKQVPGAPQIGWINPDRFLEEETENGTRYFALANCLDDAFRTATATLESRLATWGAGSREVAEWLRGQDAVFSNCSAGRQIPRRLDGAWPAVLRRDREYQRAAALFYALDYEAAADAFRAVGDDPASPWSATARYLVPRCHARAGDYATAAAEMEAVLDDPSLAAFHRSARGLVEHYRAQVEPGEHHREMRHRLLAEPLPPTLRQDWIDYGWGFPERFDDASLDRWLLVLSGRGGDDVGPDPGDGGDGSADDAAQGAVDSGDPGLEAAAAAALALWRSVGNRLWLDAALITAGPSTPRADLDDLLAASADDPESAPGDGKTRAYHRARLLTLLGRCAEARREIPLPAPGAGTSGGTADATGTGGLSLAEGNRFRSLRAACAATLGAFLADSQLQPYGLGFDPGGGWFTVDREVPPVLLADGALPVLDGLSTAELAGIAESDALAAGPRAAIARVAWTRAVLLGDHATARALVPRLANLDPQLADDLAAYAEAAREEIEPSETGNAEPRELGDPSAADFAAALVILRFPGLHPDVHRELNRPDSLAEIDSLRQNWWCEGEYLGPALADDDDPRYAFPPPPFLTGGPGAARHGEARRREAAALAELPVAAVGLGATVLSWADAHRGDRRVPEALHRVVVATRYGCYTPDGYGPTSRAAFELLHRRYPKSPWTGKTPYWFE